jgi:hypothetical protein
MAFGLNRWRTQWGPPRAPRPRPLRGLHYGGYVGTWGQVGTPHAAPRPPALAAPRAAQRAVPPAAPAATAPASPLDAQYEAQIAQNQFRANQQIAQINALGQNERAALGENLRLLGEREPVLEQGTTNRANASGLLYSGTLGRSIGDLQTQFVRSQARLNDTFGQREASRQAQLSGIDQQLGFDDLAARLAAIDRASQAAMNAPLDPGPDSPAAMAVPAVRQTGPGRPRSGRAKPRLHGLNARGYIGSWGRLRGRR